MQGTMILLVFLAGSVQHAASYSGPDWNAHTAALRAHLFSTYDKLSPPPNMVKYFRHTSGEQTWVEPKVAECSDTFATCRSSKLKAASRVLKRLPASCTLSPLDGCHKNLWLV